MWVFRIFNGPGIRGISFCRKSKFLPSAPLYQIRFQNTEAGDTVMKKDKKLSKAMKAYLERSRVYNEFIQKEEAEFVKGKRHLANMMGRDPETFSEEDIDEAVAYLFPSGLFEKKALPFIKPPHLVFPPKKDAEFDENGRPYHYLFYTGKPNYYHLLHESVNHLNELDKLEDRLISSGLKEDKGTVDFTGSEWIKKQDLEQRLVEELMNFEYVNFLQVMDKLSQHKLAYHVKDFISKYRKHLMDTTMMFTPLKPQQDADGRLFITTKECPRKNARADVTVKSPGTGLLSINGQGIEYFHTIQSRNQILFPLELTGMKGLVDIEATVSGGGETGQAGAIRWGIAWGLRSFVSPEMSETMRLAGLLTRDFRRRERKKPGQAKARKKFTWKKR